MVGVVPADHSALALYTSVHNADVERTQASRSASLCHFNKGVSATWTSPSLSIGNICVFIHMEMASQTLVIYNYTIVVSFIKLYQKPLS